LNRKIKTVLTAKRAKAAKKILNTVVLGLMRYRDVHRQASVLLMTL